MIRHRQGVQPPQTFRIFLKSEGKEVERKRKKLKRDLGGRGLPVNIFLRVEIISGGGGGEKFSGVVEIFPRGVEIFWEEVRFFREGLRCFPWCSN